jgi:hypothetical protein
MKRMCVILNFATAAERVGVMGRREAQVVG